MKLTQLEQVIEVARFRNISMAAEKLYISQPKLSLSIKRLEQEIGTDIFIRTGNGVSLTRFGQIFVRQAQNIMDEMETMERMCQSQKKIVSLELKIGSMGSFNLNDLFSEVFRKYSENPIEIRWFDMALDEQITALKNGDIEIGLSTVWGYKKRAAVQNILAKGLDYHRIAPARVGIFVSKTDTEFIAAKSSIKPEDLADKPIVILKTQSKAIMHLNDFGYKVSPKVPRFYVDNLGTMREAINSVHGYGFGTCCDAIHPTGEIPYPDIHFIPLASDEITAEMGVVINKRYPRSILADEIISLLTSQCC